MFLTHVHNFRAVAIVGIVATHSIHNFSWTENSVTFQLLDFLFNQSSIWFVFIAGFLFQNLSYRYRHQHYFKSKLKNVISPYIIMSVPALSYFIFVEQQHNVWPGFYSNTSYEQALFFLITGKHLAPFWFVPMITLFYLCAPLFLAIDRNPKTYLFILPPTLIASFFLGRDGLLELTILDGRFSIISKAVYMFSVYLLGMSCSKYHDSVLSLLEKYWTILLLLIVLITSFVIVTHTILPGLQFLVKILIGLLFFYLLHYMDRIIGNKLSYLGHASFAIFFLHGYFLAAEKIFYTKITNANTMMAGNLFLYLLFVIFVVLLCILVTKLTQLIFKKNSRFIIGS